MKALVSLVLGNRYRERFQQQCYASWKAYADRHGFDLLVFTEPLDISPRAQSRSAAWQKCVAITHQTAMRYEQVVWMDSDILINSSSATSVFDSVPLDKIGAVADFSYPSAEAYRTRLALLEERWRAQGGTVVPALTPGEYYRAFGLPPLTQVVQTGVIVLCPEFHNTVFRRTYDTYEDRGSAAYHYEMRPLSYEILTSCKVSWLDPRFNMVLSFGIRDSEVEDFTARYRLTDRIGTKLKIPLSARQRRLSKTYRRLMCDSFFLHFAGRQHEMFLV